MAKIIVFCYLLLHILGCSIVKHNFLRYSESITFDSGLRSNPKFAGFFKDKNSNEEFFFVADPVTKKRIDLFDQNGQRKQSIPLDNASEKLNEIKHFQIISKDTILTFSEHTGRIAIINSNGNIWKYWELDSIIQSYNNYYISYPPPYTTTFTTNDTVYLQVEYVSKSKNTEAPNVVDYFKEALYVPYMIGIYNLYDDSLKYEFGIDSFYTRFMNENKAMTEFKKISIINNRIVITSVHSDSVYIFNKSMEFEFAFKVSSNYTDVGVEPVQLISTETYYDYLINKVSFGGSIHRVNYVPEIDCYLIEIKLQRQDKNDSPPEVSCALYKSDGTKICEQKLPKGYSIGYSYYKNGKLYLINDSEDSRKMGKYKFDIYEIRI